MSRVTALFVGIAALTVISTAAEAAQGCGRGWYYNGRRCVPQDDVGYRSHHRRYVDEDDIGYRRRHPRFNPEPLIRRTDSLRRLGRKDAAWPASPYASVRRLPLHA
jgi:hypothetical protein